ncbi:hypothetical protein QYE76_004402 [Lolium multiflorum]|uniref:Reverse transcriptase domain-containing protein n=1 Tax=Lolium multiflorum TaxID=4521 RepID=A0AAD8RT51_LOLMU|nr:hypothetical protein QYE76_004402 [Lolium multiflorum]
MDGGKQIKTGLVDFVPHPPARVDAYAYLEEPMEMTFGSFHFRVGKEGLHRLVVPNSLGPLAVDSDFSGSSSSFESGDEEIPPSSFTRPATSGKLADIFGSMSFGSYTNSDLSSDSESVDSFNFIDICTSIREVFADLYDGVTDPEEEEKATIYHQVCAIGDSRRQEDETSEGFDDLGNPYIDPADLTRGTMPFGLKNAGATYQRMMQKCLATQIGKNIQVYIDDIVITKKQGSSLIDDLKETFDNLDKFLLKLNPTKCSCGVPMGELLGYLVSARGIEANPEKIQAIVTMRKPTKLKEIQHLTGRVAALSRFVARLEEKGLSFYALIKQGEKLEWNKEADKAFEHLKQYEALIHGMKMAKACGATRLKIFGDSQLVAQQVMNKCDTINDSIEGEYDEETSRKALEDDVDALREAMEEDSHEKFESPWIGPYVVTEVIPGGAYRLKDTKSGKEEGNLLNMAQLRWFYA